jgi:hypothetical protein
VTTIKISERVDQERRRFLGSAAMTLVSANFSFAGIYRHATR